MIGIELCFPGGRYHATPWDAHVNEGRVEWPPSPWRLLRSLIAVWHLKLRDRIPREVLDSLIEALAEHPPAFRLPDGSLGHTRHYMPNAKSTTMVFDTFVHIGDAPIEIAWPVDLDAPQIEALGALLGAMGYLGRAESWVEARLIDRPVEVNCEPRAVVDAPAAASGDGLRLLTPMRASVYESWREREIEARQDRALEEKRLKARLKGKPVDKVKLSKRDREKAADLPERLIEVLEVDTNSLRKEGWSRPPGSQWLVWSAPSDTSLEVRSVAYVRSPARRPPTVARFGLVSQVPPRLTEALWIAERMHVALMSRSKQGEGDDAPVPPVFSGRGADGEPLEGHTHCHILPESWDRRGVITHLTLWAEMGFDAAARVALERLRGLWGRGGHDLQLVLLGLGERSEFAGLSVDSGASPTLARSRVWVSRTPFVSTRHVKRRKSGEPKRDTHGRAIGGAEHDLRRLLALRGLPEPVTLESRDHVQLGSKPVRWLDFRTVRRRGSGSRGANPGTGWRIEFPEPVSGPLVLGYGAHFGLGQFVPFEVER